MLLPAQRTDPIKLTCLVRTPIAVTRFTHFKKGSIFINGRLLTEAIANKSRARRKRNPQSNTTINQQKIPKNKKQQFEIAIIFNKHNYRQERFASNDKHRNRHCHRHERDDILRDSHTARSMFLFYHRNEKHQMLGVISVDHRNVYQAKQMTRCYFGLGAIAVAPPGWDSSMN